MSMRRLWTLTTATKWNRFTVSKCRNDHRYITWMTANFRLPQLKAKTTKMLFQAARSVSNNNIQPDRNKKTPLDRLVVIYGNGQIENAKGADELDDEFLWVRRKAKCCNRDTYVQSNCVNCQNHLCEECGYSCTECGKFICNSCISVLWVHQRKSLIIWLIFLFVLAVAVEMWINHYVRNAPSSVNSFKCEIKFTQQMDCISLF